MHDQSLMVFHLNQSAACSMKIFDANGRLVSMPLNEALSPGAYQFPISRNGMASGIYFYQFEVNEHHKKGKIIIQ
ncbi:MAG: hypothetical protein RIQ89_122 [Bacteroidota bacterium]